MERGNESSDFSQSNSSIDVKEDHKNTKDKNLILDLGRP